MILIVARLLLYSVFAPCLAYGGDTLVVNQSLSGNQTLVSRAGTFEMGFFRPGKSPNYFIGIWYNRARVVSETIVWVANRESPVYDKFSCKLKIRDGNLVLLNESNTLVWSTNITNITAAISASLVLLDDGNLVLSYGSNSSQPIWQSFDNPTHTFLPGSKLGYNKLTNTSQLITSWRSTEDPGPGLYSLQIDSIERQYVLKWNKSVQYWTSGSWDGQKHIFALVPEMGKNYIYNFSYVDNDNESYFTYSMYNPEIISRLIIDISGQIKQLSWMDASQQWVFFWSQPHWIYGFCGAFSTCNQNRQPFCSCLTGFQPRSEDDWKQSKFSAGCIRNTALECGKNIEKTDFFKITVTSLSTNSSIAVGSAGPCHTTCANNCSCNAFSFVDNQCLFWEGDLLNLLEDEVNGKTIYIKVASKDLPRYEKNNRLPVGTVASIVGGVFVLGLVVLIVYRKKRMLVRKTTMKGLLEAFVYRDLQTATKHFSNKLGEGGFGSVFKGVLSDSSIVAVKRLERLGQGEKQFRSEVSTIGTIQHVNIVRLRGFCAEDFGLAKLVGRDFSRVLTTMRGTRGYLAPEWLSGVPITAKADVYSYGMMLFELVHGKRNAEQSEDLSFTVFPSVAANVVMVEGGDILSLLDSRLNREANVEEVMRICKVAYWCIQDEEENRPSMSLVEQMLEGISDVKMPPIPESVQFFADETQNVVFSNESSRTWKSQEQNNSSSVDSRSKTSSP